MPISKRLSQRGNEHGFVNEIDQRLRIALGL